MGKIFEKGTHHQKYVNTINLKFGGTYKFKPYVSTVKRGTSNSVVWNISVRNTSMFRNIEFSLSVRSSRGMTNN
jgi:hypothetical protein